MEDKEDGKKLGAMPPQAKALIFLGSAALLFAVILYPGENIWNVVHKFFGGIFGLFAFLLPCFLTYLGVVTAKEKTINSKNVNKIVLSIVAIILLSSCIFMFGSPGNKISESYFECIGRLYDGGKNGYENGSAAGILGGLLGYPLAFLCGYTAAELLCVLMLILDLMFVFGITAKDVVVFFNKIINVIQKSINQTDFSKKNEENGIIKQISATIEKQKEKILLAKNGDEHNKNIDNTSKKSKNKKNHSNDNDIDNGLEDDYIDISSFKQNFDIAKNKKEDNIEKTNSENINPQSKSKKSDKKKTMQEMLTKPKSNKKKQKNVEEEISQQIDEGNKNSNNKYNYPTVNLLDLADDREDTERAMQEIERNGTKLESTLKSFGVNAGIINICRGPSVTRFEVQPAPGVKISKITNLADDIALNLAASGVRIEAPIPGKAAVGIEVPNKVRTMVTMRELLDSSEFKSSRAKMSVALGKDISGNIVVTNLAKMPHLLVAGTTGSGKSVCVNSILISLLYKAAPEEVKLLLIDPKMVEFSKYKGIPHLLIPVVTDPKKAAGALNWAVNEMEERYKNFSLFGVRDITGFNRMVDKYNKKRVEKTPEELKENPLLNADGIPYPEEKYPSIVIAIDEFADLMMTAPNEVEDSICRLAQKARAAGMHLIVATQRPTVNVITGVIKANIPSRIALRVSSQLDSRTIIDMGGAEKLIGNGDMLFAPIGIPKPVRVQGCYASDSEIERVTNHIKKDNVSQYNENIEEQIVRITEQELNKSKKEKNSDDENVMEPYNGDDMLEEAIKLVVENGQASTSFLQRRLRLGYARAGRIIDEMEQMGIVGPHVGSKSREVLMSYQEWLERQNNNE